MATSSQTQTGHPTVLDHNKRETPELLEAPQTHHHNRLGGSYVAKATILNHSSDSGSHSQQSVQSLLFPADPVPGSIFAFPNGAHATLSDSSDTSSSRDRSPDLENFEKLPPPTSSKSQLSQLPEWLLRSRDHLGEENFENSLKYDLRQLATPQIYAHATWYDADDSGSFNPKRSVTCTKSRKRKRARTALDDRNDREESTLKKRQKRCITYGRWTEDCAPTMISLSRGTLESDAGKALADILRGSKDNWPDDVEDLLLPEQNLTNLDPSTIQPFKLRQRKGAEKRLPFHHHRSVDGVTLGHPTARGCRNCYETGLRCSLIDDEERWPCIHCREDREECELILEPLEKRACEHCKKRRIVCSFRTHEDHRGPCEECQRKGFKCVAGPKSGRARTGPSLSIHANRSPTTSVASLSEESHHCHGPAVFFKLFNSDREQPHIVHGMDSNHISESMFPGKLPKEASIISSELMEGVEQTVQGFLDNSNRIIGTTGSRSGEFSFMSLTVINNNDNLIECDWCVNPRFGIESLKTCGYRNDGNTMTFSPRPCYMCVDCADARIEIMTCREHKFEPLSSVDMEQISEETLKTFIESSTNRRLPFKLCAICGRPAHQTCKKQKIIKGQLQEGCGLDVCGQCSAGLQWETRELDESLRKKKAGTSDYGNLLRADALLLTTDSPVYKHLEESMERGMAGMCP